jgi:membrane dipeptidase
MGAPDLKAVRARHADLGPTLDTVIAALAECGVIDGHNDLAYAARSELAYGVDGLDTGVPAVHTDLPRLAAGGVAAQFWSVYVPVDLDPGDAVRQTLEQIDFVDRLMAR